MKRVPVFVTVILFATLFYARSFGAYFVADDYEFAGRMHFQDVPQYLSKGFGAGNEYRPLLPWTYAFDEFLGSGSPVAFHLTNTLLHTVNAFLVLSIAKTFRFSRLIQFFAAAAFLINPVAHESVLWISGRPVVLCTLFLLLAVWCFVQDNSTALVGTVLCLLLALGTYEMGVIAPFALAVLGMLPRFRNPMRNFTLLAAFLICAVYVLFWLKLFHFQIFRFPVERSVSGMASSLLQALTHSLHGSTRILVAIPYLLLLLTFCRNARGRQLTLFLFTLFGIGYLPFFLIQGFADRFAYLSSIASMLWLASAIADIPGTKLRLLSVTALLSFFGIGMQNRITTWYQAGEIARTIPAQVKVLAPTLKPGSTIVIENAPLMYKQAYVFISGLPAAIENVYGYAIDVRQGQAEQPSRHFRWDGSHIVQKPN